MLAIGEDVHIVGLSGMRASWQLVILFNILWMVEKFENEAIEAIVHLPFGDEWNISQFS